MERQKRTPSHGVTTGKAIATVVPVKPPQATTSTALPGLTGADLAKHSCLNLGKALSRTIRTYLWPTPPARKRSGAAWSQFLVPEQPYRLSIYSQTSPNRMSKLPAAAGLHR